MSPEALSAFVAAIPMPVVALSDTARVVAANRGAERIFGSGIVGRHHAMVLRTPVLQRLVEEALASHGAGEADFRTFIDGHETDWRVRAAPVRVQGLTGALVSFEDLTTLREAGQIRRDFVANVSHELRTPLTALIGFIETLRTAARDDPAARERFLAIMEREALRMNRLVMDLLSLSRVEAEERMRPTAPVDLAAVAASAVQSLRAAAAASGVGFETALPAPGSLPPVAGDADQLLQVVSNLLENAVKYGRQPGIVRLGLETVARDSLLGGPALRLWVEDEGEGIDPVHIPRLTERFYRVDSHRSRAAGGTGLGLAIVKHIVNRHRGRLRIESEKGRGSRFSVVLPQFGAGHGLS